MADILIRGISLPEDELKYVSLWVYGDGRVYVSNNASAACSRKLQDLAVPLPEGHGDLIDRDALKKRTPMVIDYSAGWFGTDGSIRPVRGYGDWQIDQAPTIVPAEGGTEECSEN